MPRGSRPGERRGGRQKGTPNKRTTESLTKARRVAEAIAGSVKGAFEGDAHALLMAVYKDPSQPWDLRIDAAKAAVKFEKPALSSVEARVHSTVEMLSDEALDERIAQAAVQAGVAGGHTEH